MAPRRGRRRGARSCAAIGNRRSRAQAFDDTANSRKQSASGVTHGYDVSTAATLAPGVALHDHARRAGLPLEAPRGCWMPADSNPTNEMLAFYRFCRFWTPPSAPAASADAPTNPLTRSGRSHQPIQRFGDAPGPAGLSLRPVSPPFFECRMCIPTSQELRVVGSDERRALMFKFDAGRKYITCASAHTPITMKSETASYECVV